MNDLKRLEELDPELAAWWRKRRIEAWREVGLTRPISLYEAVEAMRRLGEVVERATRKIVARGLVIRRAIQRAAEIEHMQKMAKKAAEQAAEREAARLAKPTTITPEMLERLGTSVERCMGGDT